MPSKAPLTLLEAHSASTEVRPLLSVVVPIYNAEEHIERLLEGLSSALVDLAHELIFVDDASSDASWQALTQLRQPGQRIYRMPRRVGQHLSTLFGIAQAKGAYIATIDDDLQYAPTDLIRLLNHIDTYHLHLVYGITTRAHPLWIRLGSRFMDHLFKWMTPIKKSGSSCRIMRDTLSDKLLERKVSYIYLEGLLARVPARVGYCKVSHKPQKQSRYSPLKRIKLAVCVLIHYSHFMLRLLTIGIALVFIELCLGPYWAFTIGSLLGYGLYHLCAIQKEAFFFLPPHMPS